MVSGWAISPTAEEQTVYGDQSHQWAEIGLKEYGWIPFDPTPGGAPDRAESRYPDALADAPGTGPGDGTTGGQPGIEQNTEESGSGPGTGTGESSLLGEQAPEFLEETALQNLADALDPSVRKDAAEILGEIGSDQALEGLAHAMFNDADESVREASIVSMTSLEFERLREILQKHPDPLLRQAAAICLGRKGDPRALNPLGNSLASQPDENEDVRAAAASALGELLKPEAEEPLSQALANDQSPTVREASAEALGALGQSGAAESLEQALADDARGGRTGVSGRRIGRAAES